MVIYKIENTVNGKVYIGQTIQKNPMMRWYAHCADARRGKKTHLYDSMRKYGIDKFTWTILESGSTIQELDLLEQKWLEHFRSITEVYNNREAGGNKTHSIDSIEKMKVAQRLAHAKRRAEGREGGWTRIDGGPMKGKEHPKKGKPSKKWSLEARERYKIVATEREAQKRLAKGN